MLDHLGMPGWAASVVRAIERAVARSETRTVDLGGTAGTEQAGDAVVAELASFADSGVLLE